MRCLECDAELVRDDLAGVRCVNGQHYTSAGEYVGKVVGGSATIHIELKTR